MFRHKGRSRLKIITGRTEVESMAADLLRDESNLSGAWCEEAAWPGTPVEAAAYVEAAARKGGVTISGGRTGIVAGALPAGGCALSTAALLGVRTGSRPGTLRAGAGVTLKDFRAAASGISPGRFFPPDPTEETATLGGMAATDASGSDSYLYGSTRRWISGLEAVLSGGRIITLERGEYSFDKDGVCRHPEIGMLRIPTMDRNLSKNAAGYWLRPGMDLIDLLVGSEGTLCLISSIEVLLSQCPEELLSIVAFPESLEGAWSLLEGLRSSEARVRALELLDSDCLAFLRRHVTEEAPPPPMIAGAAVICRIESSSEGLDRTVDEVLALLSESGIRDDAVWGGTEEAEQRRIRSFRHSLPEAVNVEISSRRRAVPGIHKLGSDSAVAQNLLPEFYREMVSLLDDRGLEHLVFGHAGQGHLHANVLPSSETGMAAGEEAMNRIAEVAVSLGGTVSAEHGLGRLKAHQLGLMYHTGEVEAMKGLRLAIDPERVFGPAIPWP